MLSLAAVFLCFCTLLQQCCGFKSVRITVVSVVAHGGVRWWRDQANTTWSAAVLLQVEGQREKPEAFWPSWCSWVQSGNAEIDCIIVYAFWLHFSTQINLISLSPLCFLPFDFVLGGHLCENSAALCRSVPAAGGAEFPGHRDS